MPHLPLCFYASMVLFFSVAPVVEHDNNSEQMFVFQCHFLIFREGEVKYYFNFRISLLNSIPLEISGGRLFRQIQRQGQDDLAEWMRQAKR